MMRDESEGEEAKEEDIELLEARGDSVEVLDLPKEPFDLIALFVKRTVVLPTLNAVGPGRNDRGSCRG